MTKRFITIFLISTCLVCCGGIATTPSGSGNTAGYSSQILADAIRSALKLSIERAANNLSQQGAYLNSEYHIGLPTSVDEITGTLRQFGLGKPLDQLEESMNVAAELAVRETEDVMLQAADQMSVDDALSLLTSGDTAATTYFENSTRETLTLRYQTILSQHLQALSFYPTYKSLLKTYNAVPMTDKPSLDLEQYAVDYGLTALYTQIAKEEKKIRDNPMEQGSALIAKVFGLYN